MGDFVEIKNIDQYFSSEILRRGYDYYKNGNVKEILNDRTCYKAKVKGSEVYQVSVELGDEMNLSCSCPYAKEFNCKHMAAVLYCLKTNSMPIKEKKSCIGVDKVTGFKEFQNIFRKEYNKLFHNRNYIYENEVEDYENLIHLVVDKCKEIIQSDYYTSYYIFEYLLVNIDGVTAYDEQKEISKLFDYLFGSFNVIFSDNKIFGYLLSFFKKVNFSHNEELYFYKKRQLLDSICNIIKNKEQALKLLTILKKIENSDSRYYYYDIVFKIFKVNYDFCDKEKALEIAYNSLDSEEVCNFLLDLCKDDLNEQIKLLNKIIYANNGYDNSDYYEKLLSIYENYDSDMYLDTIKRYYSENPCVETYSILKEQYDVRIWPKARVEYLKIAREHGYIYMDICLEEGLYYEVLDRLKDCWIQAYDDYLDSLICHVPESLLKDYKEKVIEAIASSGDRQQYRKCFTYFINLMKIPGGIDELKNIISDIRNTYTNKRALLEEIEFFEITYL